jgi:hypothetical protein
MTCAVQSSARDATCCMLGVRTWPVSSACSQSSLHAAVPDTTPLKAGPTVEYGLPWPWLMRMLREVAGGERGTSNLPGGAGVGCRHGAGAACSVRPLPRGGGGGGVAGRQLAGLRKQRPDGAGLENGRQALHWPSRRTYNDITTCAWVGSDALAFGGPASLYLFSFLADNPGGRFSQVVPSRW